jgi:hypothetical protein
LRSFSVKKVLAAEISEQPASLPIGQSSLANLPLALRCGYSHVDPYSQL